MSTYAEIQAQIAELKRKAIAVRTQEVADAKAKIAEIMTTYDLTLADLASAVRKGRVKQTGITVPAKYQDPVSGKTWSGRGREPLWISGKKKDDFLIM